MTKKTSALSIAGTNLILALSIRSMTENCAAREQDSYGEESTINDYEKPIAAD